MSTIVPFRKHASLPAIPGPRDVAAAWLDSLAPNTKLAYGKDLADFAGFLMSITPDAWADSELNPEVLATFRRCPDRRAASELLWAIGNGTANALATAYATSMDERKLASATIARRLTALRSIVAYGRRVGRIVWTLDVKSPPVVRYRDVRGPGKAEWKALAADARSEASKGTAKARRDLAILLLMGDRGIRRAEVVGLDYPVDFDRDGSAVWILGKGRRAKERLTINARTLAAMVDFLASRGTAPGPFFTRLDRAAKGPTRLTDWSVWWITRQAGRRTGLARDVRPHELRHESITDALDQGYDVRDVRQFSRHAKLDTVLLYDDRRTDVAGEITRSLGGE